MNAKLLSRMTARGAGLDGAGGRLQVNASDIAAALAYGVLSEPACHVAFAKYCDDADAGRKLLDHLENKIQAAINANRWHDAPGRARALALIVFLEQIRPAPCPRCRASGSPEPGTGRTAPRRCGHCRGGGNVRLSGSRKAAMAAMAKSSWTRTWEARTREFAAYVSALESELVAHIKLQLFSPNG